MRANIRVQGKIVNFADMIELWIALGTVIAMAVLAATLKPQTRHEALTYFLRGAFEDGEGAYSGEPVIEVYVGDRGPVFTRRGFGGLLRSEGSSVALAVTVAGSDITIKERITPGRGEEYTESMVFDASPLRLRGNYHVHYVSDDLSRSTAFSLLIKPGVSVRRELRQ